MQKYRSLWCRSSANDNRLYFVHLAKHHPRQWPILAVQNGNLRINSRSGGLTAKKFSRVRTLHTGLPAENRRLNHPLSLFPSPLLNKAQNWCNSFGLLCELWRIEAVIARSNRYWSSFLPSSTVGLYRVAISIVRQQVEYDHGKGTKVSLRTLWTLRNSYGRWL